MLFFDDMLATILAQPTEAPAACVAIWRQLVDLLAQGRGGADDPIAAVAFARVAALWPEVPLETRRAAAIAIGHGRLPAPLVALFAEDMPQIAAPVLGKVKLGERDWLALLPRLGPTARSLLRHRRDLPAPVRRALESFGAADLILAASPEAAARAAVVPVPARVQPPAAIVTDAPSPLAEAVPGESQIRDLMARIEAYRQHRRATPPGAPATSPATSDGFRFETDDLGVIRWIDGLPRGALIGESIAEPGESSHGVDAHAAGACRRRAPFRDARLRILGSAGAAGDWRISAVPVFAPGDGRFTGYRGSGRRPRPDEEAGPRLPAGLFGGALPADSLRQLVHELRTPINAVAGFAEMIERQMLGPAAIDYRVRAADILAQARRLLGAVDDLDLAARLDTQRLPLERGAIDPVALLARVRVGFEPLAAVRGVTVRTRIPDDLPELLGDDFAIERMIARLASAVIGLAATGEEVVLSAATAAGDTGALAIEIARPLALAGRAEAMLLDPGYGPDGDWPDAPALGLGFALRLVRNLAAASQGRLEIDADRFRLVLPVATAPARIEGSA